MPWFVLFLLGWGVQLWLVELIDAYTMRVVSDAFINIILAVSLNLVNGFTGLFSMGHAGFMAIGAYVSASITLPLSMLVAPGSVEEVAVFVLALLVGALVASGIGFLVGLPSLRLRGDYLAVVTLGFGEIIRVLLLNIDAVGGARGLTGIAPMSNFGWLFSSVLVTLFVVSRIVNSSHGRMLLAVREDEIAAQAMGVNATQTKVRVFVMGAFFAGLGGALYAHHLQYLNPQAFDFNRSFEFIIMVVLGGMGSISGSVFAAGVLTILKEVLRTLQEITGVDLRMIVYALMLIVLMSLRPRGIFGNEEVLDIWRRFRARRALS
jgi:branched-chain amino acid transport system permease protein